MDREEDKNSFSTELLNMIRAYWRAANYLPVGQIYLYDNPRLKQSLSPTDHLTEVEAAILARSRR